MQPPTGPDSTSAIGSRCTRSTDSTPPCEPISSSEPAKPPCAQIAIELVEIGGELRADIGIGGRGRGAFVLEPFARQFRAGRDVDARQHVAQPLGRALLVYRIDIGIEKRDRDRLDAERGRAARPARRAQLRPSTVRISPDAMIRSLTSNRRSRSISGGSRRNRRLNGCVRLPRPISSTSRNPRVVTQCGAGAGALNQRVDDQRGAVLDELSVAQGRCRTCGCNRRRRDQDRHRWWNSWRKRACRPRDHRPRDP